MRGLIRKEFQRCGMHITNRKLVKKCLATLVFVQRMVKKYFKHGIGLYAESVEIVPEGF